MITSAVWTSLPTVPLPAAEAIEHIEATPLIVQAFNLGFVGDGQQALQTLLPNAGRADDNTLGSGERLRRPFEHMPLRTTETVRYEPTVPGRFRAKQVEALGDSAQRR